MVERVLAGEEELDPTAFKKWILADTDPWFTGIHCWRIQLKNPNKGWFSIGVANQDIDSMNEDDFDTKYVWGIGACNNWYQKDCLGIYKK